MLKYCIFCIVSILYAIVALADADGSCLYPECIFEGRDQGSEVERYMVFLNISLLPEDIEVSLCPHLEEQNIKCKPLRIGCLLTPEFDYDYRLKDGAYVKYIVDVGIHACENIPEYLSLKHCFTPKLQEEVQSCIHRGGYDAVCLKDKFDLYNHCSPEVDEIYHNFISKWLLHNPYNILT